MTKTRNHKCSALKIFFFLGGTLLYVAWTLSETVWDICTQNTTRKVWFKNTDPYKPNWKDFKRHQPKLNKIVLDKRKTFLLIQKVFRKLDNQTDENKMQIFSDLQECSQKVMSRFS